MIERYIGLPIFKIRFSRHDDTQEDTIKKIYSSESIEKLSDNENIIKSDYDVPGEKERDYEHIIPFLVQDISNTLLKEYNYKFTLSDVWFWYQIYKKNNYHGWHTHPSSSWSSVYFLKLEDHKQSTMFFDEASNQSFQLNVKEGDILIFPSLVKHQSPKIITDSEKIVISLNIN